MEGPTGEESILAQIGELFFVEVFLGLALGALLGFLGFRLIKTVQDDPFLTTILTLAMVIGGYSLASILHTSGPLAMVVAGLYLGNQIEKPSFNQEAKGILNGFWHVLDESLNGVLFVFLGLAIHLVEINWTLFLLTVIMLLWLLISRFISVALPYSILKHTEHSWINTSLVLTWGGLRGGISLALCFSLDPELSRDTLILMTYSAVIFSIVVQGLTISPLTKRLYNMS